MFLTGGGGAFAVPPPFCTYVDFWGLSTRNFKLAQQTSNGRVLTITMDAGIISYCRDMPRHAPIL